MDDETLRFPPDIKRKDRTSILRNFNQETKFTRARNRSFGFVF